MSSFRAVHIEIKLLARGGNPYCCKPVSKPGSSWCQTHAEIVWVKPNTRRYFEELAAGLEIHAHQRAAYVTLRLAGRAHDTAFRMAVAA